MAKGTCLCKSIEINSSVDAQAAVACSCTSCQACSGSIFTINLTYPKGSIDVTKGRDHLKVFKVTETAGHLDMREWETDSGIIDKSDADNDVFRYFCDTCGNAIYTQTVDGTYFVKGPVMKALNNDPQMHIFTRNLPSWAAGIKTGDHKKDGAS